MTAVLNVSIKQWAKFGLTEDAYKKIKKTGHSVIWTHGNAWAFREDGPDFSPIGNCKYSVQEGLKPDTAFLEKYEELTGGGWPLTIAEGGAESKTSDKKKIPVKKPPSATSSPSPTTKKASTSWSGLLKDAAEVGVMCAGTSSKYRVYMVSDDCNIAYRLSGNDIAIRAEGFTADAKKALTAWGFGYNKASDGRPYCSAHLTLPSTSKKEAARTLGAVSAMVLTGKPKDIMAAGDVL